MAANKGFVRFPMGALHDDELGSADLRVLLAVASFANAKSGYAFPSQGKIASRARCSRQTTNKAVRRLADRGWLRVQHRQRKNGSQSSNGYQVPFGSDCDFKTPKRDLAATPKKEQEVYNHYGCLNSVNDDVDPRYNGPKMPLSVEDHRVMRQMEREIVGSDAFLSLLSVLQREGTTVIAPNRAHMRRVLESYSPLLRAEGATDVSERSTGTMCRLLSKKERKGALSSLAGDLTRCGQGCST